MTATITGNTVCKPEISFEVSTDVFEARTTIVHCRISFGYELYNPIRIWPTTYLVQDNGVKKQLVQAYEIASYPEWKIVRSGHRFTLLFEGLDPDCTSFELLEDIPEPGGFYVPNIQRNGQDVYQVLV